MKLLSYTPYSLETHGPKESEMESESCVAFYRSEAFLDWITLNYSATEVVIDVAHDYRHYSETTIIVKPGRENWYRCYQLARAIRAAAQGTPVNMGVWHACIMSARKLTIPNDGAWVVSAQSQVPGSEFGITLNINC